MHELGIVFYIIRDVKKVAEENNVKKVESVTIEVGEVSGVLTDYLEDCWNWACAKEEVMKGCKLISEVYEAVTFCEDCKKEYRTITYGKTCPYCGSKHTYLVKGTDVTIKQIEVSDGG